MEVSTHGHSYTTKSSLTPFVIGQLVSACITPRRCIHILRTHRSELLVQDPSLSSTTVAERCMQVSCGFAKAGLVLSVASAHSMMYEWMCKGYL